MKKLTKLLCLSVAAGMVPFYCKQDKEAGTFEVGGLLWSLKKTPGEERDNYIIELLPLLGGTKPSDGE